MSIGRNRWGFDGEITFECDSCGEELHTDMVDFTSAKDMAKDNGWKNRKNTGDEWENLCPACS